MAVLFPKDKKEHMSDICEIDMKMCKECGVPWKEYKKIVKEGKVHSGGIPHKCKVEPDTSLVHVDSGVNALGIILVALLVAFVYRKWTTK